MTRRERIAAVVMVFGAVSVAPVWTAPSDPPEPTREVWEQVDVVPMPKRIALTGREIAIVPGQTVLVVGAQKTRQAEIGAQWINGRMHKLGCGALPVVSEANVPSTALRLVIGTRSGNGLVEQAVGADVVNVGPDNPGRRGYEIRTSSDGRTVYLSGADAIGTLYACVTFAELLRKNGNAVLWQQAVVRDWPDVIHMALGDDFVGTIAIPELLVLSKRMRYSRDPSPEARREFLEAFQAHYDRLLRWKVTLWVYSGLGAMGRRFEPCKGQEVIREAVEYGRERGVSALYWSENPFVCLTRHHPELEDKALPPGRYKGWIRSWVMDDVRRETAENTAAYYAALGIDHIGFHDTDTGGYENPAQWNLRTAAGRERWGDDYVAATVHKHRIYYDEIKERFRQARMHVTVYPYNLAALNVRTCEDYLAHRYGRGPATSQLARKYFGRYTTFWRRMHERMPPDVTICIRENDPAVIRAYKELTPGRGVFLWFALLSHSWRSFFSEAPRWTGSLVDQPDDVIFTRYSDYFVPLMSLAVREYSWNTRAPGAAPWARLPGTEQWKHGEPQGEIYDVVLPHIVRSMFGREIAPEMTRAVSRNVEPRQIFESVRFKSRLQAFTYDEMRRQAGLAAEASAAVDEAWTKVQESGERLGLDDYMYARLTYLREVFHACKWMAQARAQNLLARELAKKQDVPGAEAAVAKGLALVEEGKADLARLVTERPANSIFQKKDYNRWAGGWRTFTADHVDLDLAGKRLAQTRTEFKQLGSLGAAPERIVEGFARERFARAFYARGAITIDGELTEADWAKAYPTECLFVYKQGKQLARAHTRARILFDDERVHFGIDCWTPGEMPVSDKDTVEVFLKPPQRDTDYVHFFVNAAGGVRHQRCRATKEGTATRWLLDNEWTCEGLTSAVRRGDRRWACELSIPVASLGFGPGKQALRQTWRVNLCRICPVEGDSELSTILSPPTDNFHAPLRFRPLYWERSEPFVTRPSMEALKVSVKTRTLPDTTATVATFGLQVEANQVIHNLTVEAEAYDASGELHARKELASVGRVFYRWESQGEYDVMFREESRQGGLRLILKCEEGRAEKWVRFGGWKGAKGAGDIFGPGLAKGRALTGACFLPGSVTPPNGGTLKLLNAAAGCLEFWARPNWRGSWLPPYSKAEPRTGRHTFIHYGPVRKPYPWHTNNSPLAIQHFDQQGSLVASLLGRLHAGWSSRALLRQSKRWQPGERRHVALVWDASADPKNQVRLYVDGRKAAGVSYTQALDRLGETPAARMENTNYFGIQIGCLNSGLCAADAAIDELRISRVARYDNDFAPSQGEHQLDKHTTALLHFDGDLSGKGMSPDGVEYSVTASAGVLSRP